VSGRTRAFVAVACVLVVVATSYVGLQILRGGGPVSGQMNAAIPKGPTLMALLSRPHLVFLQPSLTDRTKNELAVAPLAAPADRVLTGLHCSRAYVLARFGVCLGENYDGMSHLLDGALAPGVGFIQPGIASRARVSPDGRWASTTVFVAGHSYAVAGFSTQTLIYDVASGVATSLESFTVSRDGRTFDSPDFNFWGVTFAGGSSFYATLGTGGHTYLIKGDLARRTATVLRDGVECPSLSPDGTRIVYKSAVPGTTGRQWRLHILDLRTMVDRPLDETRNVDDQAEWLDNQTVLYGLMVPPTLDVDLWALPVDGGTPTLYLRHAASPAVVQETPAP
jgi:WD40-like Beta Propeller Repeat